MLDVRLPAFAEASVPIYRTKKINVVLIGGKGRVGKSTSANYLFEALNKYHLLLIGKSGLADPIKINAVEFYHWDGKKDEKGRKLLQEIGDAGRNYNEDIFCELLEDRELSNIFPNNFVLIDDWRYPNEAEYFKNKYLYEVTTIRIERNSELPGTTGQHRSENSLPISEVENLVYNSNNIYNFEVHNFGTSQELYKKLDSIISYLSTKIIKY
jgi:hypothetical protein